MHGRVTRKLLLPYVKQSTAGRVKEGQRRGNPQVFQTSS